MKISISITAEEVSTVAKELNLDPNQLFETLTKLGTSVQKSTTDDTPNNYSLEMLYDWFTDVSWPTFYFCHLIIVHAKAMKQKDVHGYFLYADQLEKLDISERSSSSRVGGSRRVCKKINSIDILFIRNQTKEKKKLFYVNSDTIEDLLRIVKEYDKEYREELENERLTYPKISLKNISNNK